VYKRAWVPKSTWTQNQKKNRNNRVFGLVAVPVKRKGGLLTVNPISSLDLGRAYSIHVFAGY
jgi:hypothetical protein